MFVKISLMQTKQFQRTRCFRMTDSTRTVKMYVVETRPELFNIFLSLICPSAEALANKSGTWPKLLIESVNEYWSKCKQVSMTCPQPDYAVGYSESAFAEAQLKKLWLLIGGVKNRSFYMARATCTFPFCRAK